MNQNRHIHPIVAIFQRACEMGDIYGALNLGVCSIRGVFVLRDKKKIV